MELKETISQLSDESLIELWKSEQLCTNEYFSTLYNINLKTFNECINNNSQLSIHIREQMLDCLINGVRKIKEYNIWEIIEELSKDFSNINPIVFIDGDNILNCVKQFSISISQNIQNMKFVIGLRKTGGIPKYQFIKFFNNPNCYLVQTLTQNKEATDHMLSMLISALNITIPKYIDFIICSNDKFALECIKLIELSNRSIKLISDKLLKNDINIQINDLYNKYNIVSNIFHNKELDIYIDFNLKIKLEKLVKLDKSQLVLIFTDKIYSLSDYESEYDFCIKNNINYLSYIEYKINNNINIKRIKKIIIRYLLSVN